MSSLHPQRRESAVVAQESRQRQNKMTAPATFCTAYIGLGANLGDAQATIKAALASLATLRLSQPGRCSSLYRSAPIEADGDDYVNAVAAMHTLLSPAELLAELQNLEQKFGRVRSYQNAPRTLDCDLLLYGQQMIHTPTLHIPHPRMQLRAFVLVPLLEIAPDITIPELGAAQRYLLALQGQPIVKLAN